MQAHLKILLVEIEDTTYLCREYDAHVTLVHIHSTQVWSAEGGALEVIVVLTLLICYFLDAYIKHGYLWKVPKGVPFSSQILHRPHNDNVLELMVVEVGSSEGHHQVPQTNQGAVRVSKQTNHHMVLQETWRFGSVLKRQQVT